MIIPVEPIISSPRVFAETNKIEGVEAYTWYRGCTPTTLSMIFNYHGRYGFPNLYCQPSSFHWDGPGGWIIDWLWNIPYCPRALVDEFADIYGFPKSGGSADQYGAWPNDHNAVIVVATNHGYNFRFEYDWTHGYQTFKREIDHGRPIYIAYDVVAEKNHSICGFGYDFNDTHKIKIYNTWDRNPHVLTCDNETIHCWGSVIPKQPPNLPSPPTGPDTGNPGTSCDFTATTTDPDGDQVAFKFDWGDGSESNWTSYVDSGTSVSASHSWSNEGTYDVKVKAKDTHGAESGWSPTHQIEIIRANQPPNTPSSPSPADGATNQSIDVDLSWIGGDPDSGDTVTYDVYFKANDSNFGEPISRGQSETTYDPGTLSYDTPYYWKIVATDNHGASTEGPVWNFTTGSRPNNPPDTPSPPTGPNSGNPGSSYSFTATTTDTDGDQVAFKFDWGDESQSSWTFLVDSGASASASHSWSNEGTYRVKVKAKDTSDAESGWSPTHQIEISEGRHENEIFSLPAGKWKMVSIPFTLDDASPNAVLVDDLGSQNDAVWKLYRWNTANGGYDKYPYVGDFALGKAFWIISQGAKTVDTGPGTDVSRQTDFVINLTSGWSQIGNPFPFSINWNEVRVRKNAEVVSISEAQDNGWIRDKIWYWDGQSYLFYQAPSGILNPYEGYWVRALLECELLVPPDKTQEAKVFAQAVEPKEEFLQLKAKMGKLEDSYNFLGFSEAATDGYDSLDAEEAPPISPYISLFFPHPEWGKNKGDYTQDIRAQLSQVGLECIWDLQVKTDQINQEIILEWENTSTFPEDLHLYLTDFFCNVLANMREKSSYRFTSPSDLESFKIIATSEALSLPENLDLTDVYSYPNPAHGKGVRFHFYLASSAKLTIKIYNIAGELIRTLVKDKVYLPGTYEELWKEDNDRGEKLARGVYIFIIQAGNPAKVISKSGKIALLD